MNVRIEERRDMKEAGGRIAGYKESRLWQVVANQGSPRGAG